MELTFFFLLIEYSLFMLIQFGEAWQTVIFRVFVHRVNENRWKTLERKTTATAPMDCDVDASKDGDCGQKPAFKQLLFVDKLAVFHIACINLDFCLCVCGWPVTFFTTTKTLQIVEYIQYPRKVHEKNFYFLLKWC